MSVEVERVGWEDGTLVTPARVTTSTGTYDVTDAVYSGSTPLSAQNLKAMEDNTERAINIVEEKAIGEVIYNNPSGSSGNITLTRAGNSFDYIEIYFGAPVGSYYIRDSKKFIPSEGANVTLTAFFAHSDTVQIIDIGRWELTGTSLTKMFETSSRIISSGSIAWEGTSSRIFISKIVGYKI